MSESELLNSFHFPSPHVKYHVVMRYLIINDELDGSMNQLLKHKLMALVRNSIRNCCSQDALCRFEPHADSQSVEDGDFLLYDSIHGSAAYREREPVTLWKLVLRETCGKNVRNRTKERQGMNGKE